MFHDSVAEPPPGNTAASRRETIAQKSEEDTRDSLFKVDEEVSLRLPGTVFRDQASGTEGATARSPQVADEARPVVGRSPSQGDPSRGLSLPEWMCPRSSGATMPASATIATASSRTPSWAVIGSKPMKKTLAGAGDSTAAAGGPAGPAVGLGARPKGEADGERGAPGARRAEVRPVSKPRDYDGTTSLREYLRHFDLCIALNGWTDAQAGGFLGVSLGGTARRMLEGINPYSPEGYAELRRRLVARYEPEHATAMYKAKLRSAERGDSQSVSEFADDVADLVRKAYPAMAPDTQEVLAKDKFIEALSDSELRLWVLHVQPESLNDAVSAAIEGETVLQRERIRRPRVRVAQEADDSLSRRIASLEEAVKQVSTGSRPNKRRGGAGRGRSECWRCHELGHFARECRAPAPVPRAEAASDGDGASQAGTYPEN